MKLIIGLRKPKIVFLLVLCGIFIVRFNRTVAAQIVINELSSYSSNDWIELYSSEDIDISGWKIRDTASTVIQTLPNGSNIGPSSNVYFVINAGNRLNKDEDKISLLKPDDTTLVDSVIYGSSGGVCSAPADGSVGRYPDGNNVIERFSTISKGTSNTNSLLPCPTPMAEPLIETRITPSYMPSPKPTNYPTPIDRPIQTISVAKTASRANNTADFEVEESTDQVLGEKYVPADNSQINDTLNTVETNFQPKLIYALVLIGVGLVICGLAVFLYIKKNKQPQDYIDP